MGSPSVRRGWNLLAKSSMLPRTCSLPATPKSSTAARLASTSPLSSATTTPSTIDSTAARISVPNRTRPRWPRRTSSKMSTAVARTKKTPLTVCNASRSGGSGTSIRKAWSEKAIQSRPASA